MAFQPSEKMRAATLNGYIASGDYSTYAEYNMAANQTVADSASVVVAFATQNRASPLVSQTPYQLGHMFTLNRSGLWCITATLRWGSAAGPGERYGGIGYGPAGSTTSQGAGWQSDVMASGLVGPPTECVALQRYLAAGSWVRVETWQAGTGAGRDLEANNGQGWGRINLAWIHA